MTLEFSRSLEEIIVSRILMTATEGFVDITALGKDGAGGLVNLNGNCLRMASEKSFLEIACRPDGSGGVSVRSTGENGSIMLSVPSGGKSALLTMCPREIHVSLASDGKAKTLHFSEESIVISMGGQGGKVTLRDESVVFEVGQTSLSLTPRGIESRCGDSVFNLASVNGQPSDTPINRGGRE